jgi:hypothetical protein
MCHHELELEITEEKEDDKEEGNGGRISQLQYR